MLTNAGPAAQRQAVLIGPSLGTLCAPLRVADHHGRGSLMYGFATEYRAWLHIFKICERTRSPATLARVVLRRAYVEVGVSLAESEARAEAARRRRRAWMTIDGKRCQGVGIDGPDYRAVAVMKAGEVVVAVVPVGQADIDVRLVRDGQALSRP